MDIDQIKKIDTLGMYKIYDIWPEIAKESYQENFEQVGFIGIDNIVFAGMGGSGAIGDMFSSILSKSKIHVSVIKGYHLPSTVNSNTLVVSTSVSGNTHETLTILKDAKKNDCKIIAFSLGGKMQEFCIKNNIEYRKIEQIHSPRASFVKFLYSMLKILGPIIPIPENDVMDSIKSMNQTRNTIYSKKLIDENPAIELADWISNIPLIYYPWGLQSAAIRFKNSLQENAKTHAITEDVVEACHNGIVAWERSSSIKPILLRGVEDYSQTKHRWNILKEYFTNNKIDYREIISVEGSILSKLMNLVYFVDYVSIYKAIMLGVNPSPVKSIDFVKEKLIN